MPDTDSREESLDQGLFDTGANRIAKQVTRRFYAPYKLTLFTSDVFLICCAFFFAALVSGYTFVSNSEQQGQAVILLVIVVTAFIFKKITFESATNGSALAFRFREPGAFALDDGLFVKDRPHIEDGDDFGLVSVLLGDLIEPPI